MDSKKQLNGIGIICKESLIMKEVKICVIGLGYVGLPLARLFSTKYKTIGYDMNPARVEALMAGMMPRWKCRMNCCRVLSRMVLNALPI